MNFKLLRKFLVNPILRKPSVQMTQLFQLSLEFIFRDVDFSLSFDVVGQIKEEFDGKTERVERDEKYENCTLTSNFN